MSRSDRPMLSEQFSKVRSQEDFGYALRDFLDRFRASPDPALVAKEPPLMSEALKDEGIADAYLAAAAAWMCHQHGFAAPEWAREDQRQLTHPYFAAKSHGLRMILLQESPPEFRVRNLFVSSNALERA